MKSHLWGSAEKFIDWSRYSNGIWSNEIFLQHKPSCGSCASSISATMLGSHQSKKSLTADMMLLYQPTLV